MDEIEIISHAELIDPQAQMVVAFLEQIGLPSDNIIANQSERAIIGQNLPAYIRSLPDEIKRDARYLSKFVVGAGFGLFDYSLNAVWNEVTLDLRKKAIAYGIDMCRIGRGVSYNNGVSPRGKAYYDNLLTLLGDKYSHFAIRALAHYEVQRKLGNDECRKQARLALEKIKQNVVNERLAECLDYLITRIEKNGRCVLNNDFKKR